MSRIGILSLFCLLVLTGCNFNLDFDLDDSANSEIPVVDVTNSQGIALVGLGEDCGSKVETLCEEGLYCKYSSGKSFGECQRKEVDLSITCENDKKPVCALKDRAKLSYLNECEARRHGATVIGEDFCVADLPEDLCTAKVHSVGNCPTEFTGYEFTAGSCEAVSVFGCELETPFDTEADCVSACL